MALDKTGTLTAGKPELTDLILAPGFDRAEVLALVAAVEARSEHPIARAIVAAAEAEGVTLPAVTGFAAETGLRRDRDGGRSAGADRRGPLHGPLGARRDPIC